MKDAMSRIAQIAQRPNIFSKS